MDGRVPGSGAAGIGCAPEAGTTEGTRSDEHPHSQTRSQAWPPGLPPGVRGHDPGLRSDGGGRDQAGTKNGRGTKSGADTQQGAKRPAKSEQGGRGKQKSEGGRQDGNRSKEGAKAQEATGQDAKAPAKQQAGKQDNVINDEFSREDQTRVATDFLSGVLERFELVGSVAADPEPAEDDAIEIAVTGEGLGLLVGQKGVTLNALQELTRTVVQRSSDGAKTERLRVDVAGYRERRRAALQDFARKIASDVVESGEEKILEPMGPADRKVVHDTVNEMDGVETGSEGEEPRRRVVIRPV